MSLHAVELRALARELELSGELPRDHGVGILLAAAGELERLYVRCAKLEREKSDACSRVQFGSFAVKWTNRLHSVLATSMM
jgi:hypothetical protein